ncbi:hypothetical protein RSG63_004229 [Yersinia enterocolitica]|nr:hypothetical protein [Yersinia enterocolitica]ELI8374853.1 hypothetical protein [Yersinia enterocolitica]ELX2274160.1 hypothetical protein [Yersinia enterocolitica]HDL6704286.1 hypothetical protein [Yersinia enterocolitica]
MGKQADIHDTEVRATVIVDDGCDWTEWNKWKMREKYRMRNGIIEPEPPRPKVAAVSFKSIKKPRKKGFRVVQKAIGAV